MNAGKSGPSVKIWTDADHASLIRAVLDRMGDQVKPVGLGGPRLGQIDTLRRELDCPPQDDARKLLADQPADFLLLGTLTGVTRPDLEMAQEQGAMILALEPTAGDFDGLIGVTPFKSLSKKNEKRGTKTAAIRGQPTEINTLPLRGAGDVQTTGVDRATWLPAFERSPGWTRATEPTEVLGQIRLISFGSFGQTQDSSLFAHLFGAWQFVIRLVGMPETIDASLVGPLGEIPTHPRAMTGHLAAHARMSHECAAVLRVSDRAGDYERRLHVVGEGGQLRADDWCYALDDPTGRCLDESDAELAHPTAQDLAQLIAMQWRQQLDPPAPSPVKPPRHDDSHTLACCLACLLSARTGQPESPQKLLGMHRR